MNKRGGGVFLNRIYNIYHLESIPMCAWLRTYPYHSYVLLSAIWSIWKKPVCWDSFGSSTTDLSCFNLEKLQEPSGTTSRAVQTPSAPKSLMNSPELTNATLRAHKVVLYSHPSPSSSCQSTGKQHSVPFSLRHHSKCAHVNLTFSDTLLPTHWPQRAKATPPYTFTVVRWWNRAMWKI